MSLRVALVTGTRADYGKLEPLALAAQQAGFAISFFVTGMHMMGRYGETRQALYAYKLTFDLPTDAGLLNYLRGRTFTVENVPFRAKYFG